MIVSLALTIVVLLSAVWSVLSLVLAWENRRFSLVRLANRFPPRSREHEVAVFVPCKGDDGDLKNNLRGFFQQKHPNYHLVLIVESEDDAAVPAIQSLLREFPNQPARLVIAGIANDSGQKVHNLMVATQSIDSNVKVLAFADADIQVDPSWLQALTWPVCKHKNVTANTGYRWMLPERNSLVNLIVSSANATLAGSMGPGGHFLLWGGSWAIRRSQFEHLKIREAWRGTLSDDLVASRVIHDSDRLNGANSDKPLVVFAPRCLCYTTFDMSWLQGIEFMRRQFLIARKYAGRFFWGGYGILAISVVAWWGLLVVAASQWGSTGGYWALLGALFFYFTGVAKGMFRQSVFRRRHSERFRRHRAAAWFDIFGGPLVQTTTILLMTTALIGNQIHWSGNHYQIGRGGKIRWLNPRVPDIRPISVDHPPPTKKAA